MIDVFTLSLTFIVQVSHLFIQAENVGWHFVNIVQQTGLCYHIQLRTIYDW